MCAAQNGRDGVKADELLDIVQKTVDGGVMNPDSPLFRKLGWLGLVLMVVAAIYLASVGQWKGAGVMAGFIVGTILVLWWKERLPSLFSFLFVLAALVNGAGWVWNLFNRVSFYDETVHGFTMCVIGLAVAFLIHYARSEDPTHPGTMFVIGTMIAALLIGVGWEIIEWIFNIIGSALDTFIDLLMDTLGGLIAGVLAAWAIRSNPPRQLRERDKAIKGR